MTWKPDCFDTEDQYDDWVDLYVLSKGYDEVPSDESLFCADCTLSYMKDMVNQGRCMFTNTKFNIFFTDEGRMIERVGMRNADQRKIPLEEGEGNTD